MTVIYLLFCNCHGIHTGVGLFGSVKLKHTHLERKKKTTMWTKRISFRCFMVESNQPLQLVHGNYYLILVLFYFLCLERRISNVILYLKKNTQHQPKSQKNCQELHKNQIIFYSFIRGFHTQMQKIVSEHSGGTVVWAAWASTQSPSPQPPIGPAPEGPGCPGCWWCWWWSCLWCS